MSEGQESAPSPAHDNWERFTVHFPGFTDLSTEQGDHVESHSFHCFGHEWSVCLGPLGETAHSSTISLYLRLVSVGSVEIGYSFSIKDDIVPARKFTNVIIGDGNKTDMFGTSEFRERSEVVDSLKHGVLAIEVRMKLINIPLPYIPDNPSACKIVQELFMEKDHADVVFEVGGGCVTTGRSRQKKAKKATSLFYAHRMILEKAAPQLVELIIPDKSPSRVEIPHTSSESFRALLLHIYGCDIPELGKDIVQTREILELANKYGVTNLKLKAEAYYVFSTQMTFKNVMDHLLFAESMSCALLKEVAVDFIVKNIIKIVEDNLLVEVPGGLVKEVMTAVARNEKKRKSCGDNDNQLRTMTISELRRRAHERGLDVDGTREMLIASLE